MGLQADSYQLNLRSSIYLKGSYTIQNKINIE